MPPLIPQLFYIISDAPQVQPVNSIWGGVGGGGGENRTPFNFFQIFTKILSAMNPIVFDF